MVKSTLTRPYFLGFLSGIGGIPLGSHDKIETNFVELN